MPPFRHMCAASTSLATSCIKRRDNADDAPRALTHCAIACALGCDYGLAVGWLDGLHQVETLVSPPETYAKTTVATTMRGLRPIPSLNQPAMITTGSRITMLNELISSERDGGMPSAVCSQLTR